jgi:two-component system, cell cycle sensor histidine kinase and response regulator CckA
VAEGSQGIALYQKALQEQTPYDLVLVDLLIPEGIGGRKMTEEILKLNPKVKVIVMSGYSADPVIARYWEYGFKAALAKPFSLEQLRQKLDEVHNNG